MDKLIGRLKKLINENYNKPRNYIVNKFGPPLKKSDDSIWFYRKFNFSLYKDEITIIFEEDIVVDICLTRFFLWIEVKSVYYYEGQTPEYKVVNYFSQKD